MKNIKILINRAINELKSVNITAGNIIDYEIAPAQRKYWGQCKRTPNGYIIRINALLLDESISDKITMDTVMHEVIHTVNECFNHGKVFKKIAALVNNKYGYNIKRISSATEMGFSEQSVIETYKYSVTCKCCGETSYYNRKSKVINSILNNEGRYICSKCKSNQLEVKKF